MDIFSLDEMFRSSGTHDSPGARMHLYRLLQMLAAEDAGGSIPPVSYEGAKGLSRKIELGTPERLVQLFDDLGLGTLALDIRQEQITATLNPRTTPPTQGTISGPTCELERGLIDGALEKITGMPVTTIETTCWARGDRACCFEASREIINGAPAFKPVAAGSRLQPARTVAAASGYDSTSQLRGWYLDAVGRELARSKRHDYAMSLLYLDLDNLGEVNDSLGAAAGDQIINAVANSLSRSCRTEDFLWHHGEDEFVAVLAETGTDCAEVVARRLVTEVLSAAEYVDFAASVSASIGFATFPTHAETLTELLESARSALYMAKSLGKARAQVAWDDADIRIETRDRECKKYGDVLFDWPAYRPDRRKNDWEGGEPGAGGRGRTREAGDRESDAGDSKALDTEVEGGETGLGTTDIGNRAGAAAHEDDLSGKSSPEPDAVVIESGAGGGHTVHESGERPGDVDEAEPPGTEEYTAVAGESDITISAITASMSPLLLEGMQRALTSDKGISIVGEIQDPGRIEEIIADLKPDLVFVDKEMAIADQFAGLRILKEENADGKFVIFTKEIDQDVLRAAIDFNVDGIIFQDASPKNVLSSVRNIIDGQRLLPYDVQAAIDELEHHRLLLNELSEREVEVLKLVAAGQSNSQISKELYITVNTVRFHLANIYQKLNVSNRTEAANYFLRQRPESNELS